MLDLLYAIRVFLRRPMLAAIIVATLGMGLGAAIAAFAVVDRVVLREPALADPDRLVLITERSREEPDVAKLVSPADFFDLRASGAFVSAAAWMPWNFNLTGQGTPERLRGALVSEEFFSTLGRGTFAPDGVVISDVLWRRTFGGAANIAGRRIVLGGEAFTIAGVTPRDFVFPDRDTDVWMPLVWGKHFQRDDREGGNLRVIARLRDGVGLAQANAVVRTIVARAHDDGRSARAVLVHDEETRALRPTLYAILAAAAVMLLIGCASVVNLMLMLAASRRRELATRVALGGGVLRQATAEGLVLGATSGLIGVALASLALRVSSSLQLQLPPVSLDVRIVATGMAAALLAGLAAAVLPSMLVTRWSLSDSLRASHQIASSGGRLRGALVITQVALACALLVSAGVLAKSFSRLMAERPGFDPHNVLTARVWLPGSYDTSAKQRAFFDALLARLAQGPGVRRVATIQDLPLRGNAMTFRIAMDSGDESSAAYRVVSDGYFDAMRIPILRGRGIARTDDERAPHVFVINGAFARRAFAGRDPIGHRIRVGDDGAWGTIVGIAGDVKQMGLDADEVPALYEPSAQKAFDWLRWTTIVLRTDSAMPDPASTLRAAVASIDPDQPIAEVAMLDTVLGETVAKEKLSAWIVAALGAIAFVIALIGIGGVLSYAVALRSREFGVRIALGAAPRELMRLVFRDGARLVLPGIAAGLAIAISVAPMLDRLLFRIAAFDTTVYAIVAFAVIVASAIAVLLPARRASRVDPAKMLAAE